MEIWSKTVAVLEDEGDIRELIQDALQRAGFKTFGFSKGEDFLRFLRDQQPDLLILDLLLPDGDGLDICKYLRSNPSTMHLPILIVTARGAEEDRVLGLELGADDYLVKPFSLKELVARVKALLRRPAYKQEGVWVKGLLYVDFKRYEAFVAGHRVDLTPTEFKILQILVSRKGWVFSRSQLLDHLWGTDKAVSERTIDVHVKNLREKLGEAGKFIKSVRGVGYKIQED